MDTTGTSKGFLSGKLFSRDLNYLRDVILVWPFIIFSLIGVGCLFSPDPQLRQLGIRCVALAIAAGLLAKEKLLVFFGALGFIALQGSIALVLHPWRWSTFAVAVLTGVPFVLLNRYWREPKLAYQLPDEYRAVDILLSFASICGTLFLFYLVRPHH